MAIGPRTTARSGSDSRWMGSRHAVAEAQPGTLSAAAFTGADGVENGVVPSGYPVMRAGDLLAPWDGEGDLYGFSIDNRDISTGDEPTAVMWHGRIITEFLPTDFEPPAAPGAFVYA